MNTVSSTHFSVPADRPGATDRCLTATTGCTQPSSPATTCWSTSSPTRATRRSCGGRWCGLFSPATGANRPLHSGIIRCSARGWVSPDSVCIWLAKGRPTVVVSMPCVAIRCASKCGAHRRPPGVVALHSDMRLCASTRCLSRPNAASLKLVQRFVTAFLHIPLKLSSGNLGLSSPFALPRVL